MANRLWPVPVNPTEMEVLMGEEMGLLVPDRIYINAEYITKIDLSMVSLTDTWRVDIHLVNALPVTLEFQTKQEALDEIDKWANRVEHAGATLMT